MQIAKNSVVLFHYRLREEEGDELESSHGGNPAACLIGHGNIIPGLEKALYGKTAGDSFSATIAPHDAYGARQRGAKAKQRVPIKHLHGKSKLRPGMVVAVQTEQGARQVVIEKVGRFNVDVDTNHPLAGKTLVFEIEITDVREASAEEINHGHVHGAGGHHH